MLTVAGVVAKNNLVVDAEQKTIVNRMMVIMNKRWCSSSYVVDESHLYMMRGLLDRQRRYSEVRRLCQWGAVVQGPWTMAGRQL